MIYGWLADLLLGLHLAFILFVVLGGLAVLRWPRLAWLHLPAAAWGAAVEYANWICPLTPLEVTLRRRAGEAGYEGGFIEHYVAPVVYPDGLSRDVQIVLGTIVVGVNAMIYGWMVLESRRRAG